MIIRATPLKDASGTGTTCACSGAGQGTIADLGALSAGDQVRAALHILSSTAGGLKVFIQANSSSGYTALNVGTDLMAFTSRTCRDSQFSEVPWNCASATSTDRKFWRAAWTQTCAQTNNWLVGIEV